MSRTDPADALVAPASPASPSEASDAAPTDLFLGLTPERVLEAVEAGGLETRPVCYQLNAYENRVYEVELADRSRVIAKFYRPLRWSEEQILEEHAFLDELAAEEVPVCTFRPFPEGGTLRTIDGIHYGLMDRRGGRAPDEIGDALARRLGMLAGRIHSVGARREAPNRPRMGADTSVRANLDWFRRHGTIPAPYDEPYFRVAESLADLYDDLSADVPVQRIHGDLHRGNILERDGLLRALDFDDFVNGPPVQDLWLAFPGRDLETRAARESFLEGYEQFRPFDRTTLRLVEPLRGLRIIAYSAWLARRWHDPFFPKAFPHFGTESYWQTEIQELEEALAAARKDARAHELADPNAPNPLSTSPIPEEETVLTNKDYFWDWEGD